MSLTIIISCTKSNSYHSKKMLTNNEIKQKLKNNNQVYRIHLAHSFTKTPCFLTHEPENNCFKVENLVIAINYENFCQICWTGVLANFDITELDLFINIKHVNFTLHELLTAWPNLQTLNIYCFTNANIFQRESLDLTQKYNNITSITIKTDRMYNDLLENVAKLFPKLKNMEIIGDSDDDTMQPLDLTNVLKRLPKLVTISLKIYKFLEKSEFNSMNQRNYLILEKANNFEQSIIDYGKKLKVIFL